MPRAWHVVEDSVLDMTLAAARRVLDAVLDDGV